MRSKFSLYLAILYILSGTSFAIPSLVRSAQTEDINKIPQDYIKNIPTEDYILGPGDTITVNVSDEYPELKVSRRIDGLGTIYLPRLKRIFVSGLTVNELNKLLNNAYKEFVKYPSVEVSIESYRVIRITVRGEVNDPGVHTLEGAFSVSKKIDNDEIDGKLLDKNNFSNSYYFPTLFDALRESGGITEFSDLSKINIIRKNKLSNGGGAKTTNIDFNSILFSGDLSQNIRIYDSDIITVNKLKTQQLINLRKAISSNLNPRFVKVLVSGRVKNSGPINLPKSSVLNDALELADINTLRGKVTFIRFNNDGTFERRKFNYGNSIKRGSFKNPILKNNDIIVVGDNIISSSNQLITEITSPFIGIFSTYGLIKALQD